jgi:hypothetical protein
MLKYLFTVDYRDGTSYSQNEQDVSVIEPEKRSCFFDVRKEDIKKFSLVGDGHTYSVDLDDGHFEIDGIPFRMHDEELKDFRIIFFRKHQHGFNDMREELFHKVFYQLGWQTTLDGKNIQRVMELE